MPDTYFENPVCPTPGLDGDLAETRGGFTDFSVPGASKGTANPVSGLPLSPDTMSVPQAPSRGATYPPPDLTNWPTIVTK